MKDFRLISLPSPATRRKRTTTGLTVDLLGVSQGVCLELAIALRQDATMPLPHASPAKIGV